MTKELVQKAHDILRELQSSGSGGRKGCKLGKPCKATCISRDDKCRVSFPGPLSNSLSKAAQKIGLYNNKSYNWAELVTAVVILNPSVSSREDIIKEIKNKNLMVSYPEKYVENLNLRSDKDINNYISSAKKYLPSIAKGSVSRVYVLGATAQGAFPEVEKLNKGLSAKEKKSDVIVITDKGPVGISVKSNPNDRLTNYSLEGMTGENGKKLREERKSFMKSLTQKGLTPQEVRDTFAKKDPPPFVKNLYKFIEDNKSQIITEWIKGMSAGKSPYPVYQFDGVKLKDMGDLGRELTEKKDRITILAQPRTGKGTSIYYEVFIDGEKRFQWEFRKVASGATMETRVREKPVTR